MDKQKILNKVVKGLEAQGWRHSVIKTPGRSFAAMINAERDCRCALGLLMTESDAIRFNDMDVMDQIPWNDINDGMSPIAKRLGAETGEDVSFLNQLQNAHDLTIPLYKNQSTVPAMKAKLRLVAERFNLEKPRAILEFNS